MKLIEYKIEDLLIDKISGEWGKEPSSNEAISVIRTANFLNNGKINYDNLAKRDIELKKIEQKALKYGDIIIEKSGGSPTQPVGRVVYFDKEDDIYLTNNFTHILRPDLKKVDSKFLFYLLHYNHRLGKTLKYQNKTIGIINLKLSRYLNSEVKIPQKTEYQKKVSILLSQIENLIQKREKSIELLDNLIKSTFLDMFGDPISNSQNRPTDFFEKIVKFQRGYDLPKSNRNEKGEYFVYGSNGILATHDKYKCSFGIITGRSGTIGEVFYSDKPFWPLNTTLFSIDTFGNNLAYLRYLVKFFKLDRFIRGGGVPTLNRNIVHKEKIYIVDKNLQNKFAEIVIKIENTKKIYENSLNELKQLFNSTSQKAFKGELDLNIVTLEFEDKFPDILDEIVEEDERKNILFEKVDRNFTKETVPKLEELQADDFTMDVLVFKKLIINILKNEQTFDELDKKIQSKDWLIPYDEELNKKDKPFNYKDTIFELLKENQIVQKIREYEEDGELKRKILLKAKK